MMCQEHTKIGFALVLEFLLTVTWIYTILSQFWLNFTR